MKKIKFLIFVYAVWKVLQDINRSPRTLKFLERYREAMVDFGAKGFEKLIFPPDTKRSRKRHAS